jgi:two-component system, OmpR family, response regulator MtrA
MPIVAGARVIPGSGSVSKVVVITHTLLLVESDPACADRLVAVLQSAGHATWVAPTAAEARAFLTRALPELIVLDLQLPDEDGLRLCASLRQASDVPIVVTGAGLEPRTVVEALKLGADDVLVQDCDPDEVLARVEAVLRRASASRQPSPSRSEASLHAGALAIDQTRCRVTLRGEPVSVTPTEYRLLVALASQPGRLVSREELDRLAWGARRPTREGRRIDVCVHRLRQRLGLLGDAAGVPWLTAVRGHGYRLVVPS